jgi:hypothetical protein
MYGHPHGRGCSGWHHWREVEPLDDHGRYYVGPCRCGHGAHAHYIARDGRSAPTYEAVGEGDKLERIAFLEDEVKSLKDCLERTVGELERLKGEQAKGT